MQRRWEPCGAEFDIRDVVRWTEGVWHSKNRKKKKRKVTRLGTRELRWRGEFECRPSKKPRREGGAGKRR